MSFMNNSGMWASREMLRQDTDKQIVMKTTLRELIIYWYTALSSYNL